MGVKVRQKKKGRGEPWWVFVYHNNKRTSRKIGDRRAAEAVARKIEAKIALGEFGFEEEKRVPTFKEYADNFLNTFSTVNHKTTTHKSYIGVLDKHINPVFGHKPLNEIRKKDIKAFLTRKQQETFKRANGKEARIAPATVRNIKAYMSCILNQAVDDEVISSNPASRMGKIIKKTDTKKGVDPFSWEEKALFEESMRENFSLYYPLFLTALRTGMRIGEIIALKPGDIDFNGNFIEVRRSAVRGEVSTPKSGKARRLDMSAELRKVLKAHLTARKQETLAKGWKEPLLSGCFTIEPGT